ncbi:MAG: ribbon-helix-helix domain-containing protein [Candidatus Acidiferrales bacterium]
MKRTNIYLTDEQMKRLEGLSKKTLAPVAALVRRAIDEFLKRQK